MMQQIQKKGIEYDLQEKQEDFKIHPIEDCNFILGEEETNDKNLDLNLSKKDKKKEKFNTQIYQLND